MAYRNDVDALEARYQALEADLAERTKARDEAAQLLAEARERARVDAVLADIASGGPARRRRKHALIAGAVMLGALAAGGIGYRIATRGDNKIEAAVAQFELFTDAMCTCSTRQCADAVSNQMTRWATDMSKDWTPPPKLDDAVMKHMTDLAKRMSDCMTAVMTVKD